MLSTGLSSLVIFVAVDIIYLAGKFFPKVGL
ncbi:hypothetical protein BBC0122_019640 [Bartonella choladocola]|uniref:Uncharacterized protein n=1 Tax=Bartonella choladocola TaxID=2750995 RepID=A0A1U9MJC3_9HYPH|nr:hypothetical protein BBC0122_019640 [Bartonella choladocola]